MACDIVLQDVSTVGVTASISEHVDIAGTPAGVRQARRFVVDVLNRTVSGPVLDDVLLLTSEMVTNVVLHTHSDLHLGVARDSANVLVTVRDHSPDSPQQRAATAGPDAVPESGRGLSIIASLADEFGWTRVPSGHGKVMWFVLAIGPPIANPQQYASDIPRQERQN